MHKIDLKTVEAKKRRRPWVIIFGLLGIVITAQLVITNILASRGDELSKLEAKANEIARQNQNLREELVKKTSLTKINEESQNLGLGIPEKIIYLNLAETVANVTP